MTEKSLDNAWTTSGPWARCSLAVVIPYQNDWRGESARSAGFEASTPDTLQGFPPREHPGEEWSSDPKHWFKRRRLIRAVAPRRYLRADAPTAEGIPDGLTLSFVEDFHFDDSDVSKVKRSFLVIHGYVDSDDEATVVRIVRTLQKPGGERASLITQLLNHAGVTAEQRPAGYIARPQNAPVVKGSPYQPSMVPVVLTHLVPRAQVPGVGGFLKRPVSWTDEQAWTWQLATGASSRSPEFTAPTPTREAAEEGVRMLGTTMMRAHRNGICFLSTRGVDERMDPSSSDGVDGEHVAMARLTHSYGPRIVMLALRQREPLERFADDLAGIEWSEQPGTPDAAEKALELEKELTRFRNKLWVQTIPERPHAEAMLRTLHEVTGADALMSEIAEESQSLARLLELDADRRARAEAKSREDEREQQAELRQEEAERHEATERGITYALAVLAPPTLVFSAAALIDDPHEDLFWWSLWISAGLVVLALVALLIRHRAGDKESASDKPEAEKHKE